MGKKEQTGRYLFVKAYAREPKEWGFEPPGYAVIDLESSLGGIEHYCDLIRETQGKLGPDVKSLTFKDASPKFYPRHYLSSCDFYDQLEKAEFAVSRTLPSFISDPESEGVFSPLVSSQTNLVVSVAKEVNFSWEIWVEGEDFEESENLLGFHDRTVVGGDPQGACFRRY